MAIHRKILRWLETELFEGNIQLGQNLPDDQQIARAIGVGRSRTRDALKTLEDMELVRLYSGRGKEIIPRLYEEPAAAAAGPLRLHMSTSRFPTRDMLQTRILLESWAVSNIDPEKVSFDEVDEALEDLQDDTLSIGEFLDQLLTFHHLLARLAGNELVVGLLVAIRQPSFDSLLSLMGRLPLWSSTMTRIRVENRAIVDAVKDGDARTARELIAHQLQELYSEAGIELDAETSTPNGIPGDASDFDEDYEEESEAIESSDDQALTGEASASEEQETAAAQDTTEDSGRSRDTSAGAGAQGGESGADDASQNSASGDASSHGGEGGSSRAPQETEGSDEQENAAGTLPKIIRAGSTVSRRRRGHLRLPQPAAVGFDSSDPADSAPQTSEAAEPETAGSKTTGTSDAPSAQPESVQKTARAHEPELESVQPEFEDDVIPVEETASAEPTTDRVDVEQPIVEASVADDDLLAEPVSGPHAPARSAENREDAPQGSTGSGTSAEQAVSPGQETTAQQETSPATAQETAVQEAAAQISDTGQSTSAAEKTDAAAVTEGTSAPTSSSEGSASDGLAEKPQETKAAASAEVYVEKAPVGEISAEELVATGLIPWRSAHVEQQGTDTSQLKAAQGTEGTQSAQGSSQEQAVRAPKRRVAPPVRPAQFATRRPSKPTGSERVGFLQRVKHYFGLDLPHTQAIRLIEAQEAAEKTAAIELEKAAIAEQAAALKAMREKTAAAGKTEQSAQSSQTDAPSQDTAQGTQTQQAASDSVAQKIKTEAAQKPAAPTLSPGKPVPAVKSASTVKPGAVKQPEQSEPARAERSEATPEAATAQTGNAQKGSSGTQKDAQQPVAAQQKTAQPTQNTGQGSTSPKPQELAKSAEQGKQGTGQSAQQSAEPQTERSQAATKSESAPSDSSNAQPQQGSAQKSEESEGASAKTSGAQAPAHASDADKDKADKQESTASPKDTEAPSEQADQTSGLPMPRPVPAVSRPEADEVTSLPVASKTAEPLENSGPSEAVEAQPVSARMAAAKATATPAPASASSNPQGVAEQIKKVEKTAVKNFSQGGSALSKTKKNRRKRR